MATIVEPFITEQEYVIPGARNRKRRPIPKGTRLYGLRDEESQLVFIWVYLHQSGAEEVAERVKPEGAMDISCNWREDYSRCTITGYDGKDSKTSVIE